MRWILALAVLGFIGVVVLAVLRAGVYPVGSLAKTTPGTTALMRQRAAEAERLGRAFRLDQRWVSYARVSPTLRRAILIAEDDAFFSHGGLDWNEIGHAARENLEKRKVVRGGSTLTQQLAKNIYVGDARTPTRKLTELFLALRMEQVLTKRRIFELYLNLIEWGDGIFGAEAAARRYFGVSAAGLSDRQALLLAASIINPRRYSPLHPEGRLERRVRMIAGRMRRRGFLDQERYLVAIGGKPPEKESFSEWFFGVERDTAPPTTPEVVPEIGPEPEPEPAPPESTASDS